MERIASFSVDHAVLEPGIHASRSDADEATGGVTALVPNDARMRYPALLEG